ncbi:MAG: hydroxymethylglutaryl-CoA lyase [Methylocystis sp.]|nr:hydroxymethylglutaryl-CoA lyase [Methylocystis sp.]
MKLPARVRIVEVGPRDGLQNERAVTPVEVRVALIELLADAGLTTIEAGSFVSAKFVPQMARTEEVLARLRKWTNVRLPVLVPNLRGLEAALAAGAREIAVFAAASETFSQKNINCSIAESLDRYASVVAKAARQGVAARGYVSCVLGCPYEGEIDPERVTTVARALHEMGCYEISLGDTIGVGTPLRARRLLEATARDIPLKRLAVHFHDTYGQALANIFACLEAGVTVVDSSVAGLGGCPYAPGATGNVATEDIVYMLDGLGVQTGVDLDALLKAGAYISKQLDRPPTSRVARAAAKRRA